MNDEKSPYELVQNRTADIYIPGDSDHRGIYLWVQEEVVKFEPGKYFMITEIRFGERKFSDMKDFISFIKISNIHGKDALSEWEFNKVIDEFLLGENYEVE